MVGSGSGLRQAAQRAMDRVEIRNVSHGYELRGRDRGGSPSEGPPTTLVFIHGWMLSRHYWQPLIDRFAPDHPCLCYDLRGFGESLPASSADLFHTPKQRYQNYAPAAYAEDLETLLERLGIERAWLIGHSLGGTIALWAAHQSPKRVEGVICLNSGGGIYLKEEFERFRMVGRQLVRWRSRWLGAVPGLGWLMARDSVAQPVATRWGRQRVVDFLAAHPEAALWTLLESTTEAEVNRLPRIVAQLAQPAYFIAGARDGVMEPQYVRHLASFHPLFDLCGKNLFEIPDCGHMGMVEQPTAVGDRIAAILQGHCADLPAIAP